MFPAHEYSSPVGKCDVIFCYPSVSSITKDAKRWHFFWLLTDAVISSLEWKEIKDTENGRQGGTGWKSSGRPKKLLIKLLCMNSSYWMLKLVLLIKIFSGINGSEISFLKGYFCTWSQFLVMLKYIQWRWVMQRPQYFSVLNTTCQETMSGLPVFYCKYWREFMLSFLFLQILWKVM